MGLFDLFKGKKETPAKKKSTSVENGSSGFHSLKVSKRIQETQDSVSLEFEIPTDLKPKFQYSSGQYITLKVIQGGDPVLRSYSLSSSPDTDSFFRIGVKKKIGGKLSGFLVNSAKVGDNLDVFTPLGSFSPNLASPTTSYALIAGGSGITPMLSIAKSILAKKSNASVSLLYANRDKDSIMYAGEIQNLSSTYAGRFEVAHILDNVEADWKGLKGIYKSEDYKVWFQNQLNSKVKETEYFICGPTLMMQEVESSLKDSLGVTADKINVEYFDMDMQPASQKNATASSTASSSGGGGSIAKVKVNGAHFEVEVAKGSTLLEAILNKGIDAPFMCEAGVCASCRAKVSVGKAKMIECHSLSDKEKQEGFILTCQAIPETSEIELDYDV